MNHVDRELKNKLGVTATQVAALLYLKKNDGCFLVDLSRELLQNKSAITTLVERMAKNELLEKVPSAQDRRASQLFLTPKGRQICDEALPFAQKYNNGLSEDLSPRELDTIDTFLDGIIGQYKTVPLNFFHKKPG
ncbi:MAG: winged helix-turn-helix transcriptional regulator [Desulfobulbaceae bacterium]|nr:winged helix-turn-helix transcriptional regulator [Desulfobulbaceae bacterium]